MRDYDLEDFLKHYGVPGMKRPSGLKYKTGRINATLYSNRQRQMARSDSDSQGSENREWHKEKYIKDTNNKIEPIDPSKPKSNNQPYQPEPERKKFSSDKRDKFRRARREQQMAEANIEKAFERTNHMFDQKEMTETEKELENVKKRRKDIRERVKKNPLTRYGVIVKRNDPNSRYEKVSKYKEQFKRSRKARSINDIGKE